MTTRAQSRRPLFAQKPLWHAVLTSPEFWEGLHAFLQIQFGGKIDDANSTVRTACCEQAACTLRKLPACGEDAALRQ